MSTPPRRSAASRSGPVDGASPEGWRLGSLAGVPVILARSWFVIAAIITVTFEPAVARADPTLSVLSAGGVAFGYAVLLGLSVLVHELAHALTARSFGLPASRIVLTLWGGHTQFEQDVPTPARSFAVAVAGPASNGVLALAAWAVVDRTTLPSLVQLLLDALAITNGFVALTNVLPGLPLDGGRLLEALVWRVSGDRELGTIAAGWVGRVVAVAVPLAAVGRPLLRGDPVSWLTVVWACALGALLWAGAGAAVQGARIRRRAPAASTAALAHPAVGVPAGVVLSEALAASARVEGGAWVVLLDGSGQPAWLLDPAAVDGVPAERRGEVPAASASRALTPGALLREPLAGQDLLRELSGVPAQEWVVLDAAGAVSGLLLVREVVSAVMGPRAASRA